MKEYFYIETESIRYCYPYECSKTAKSYGVLEPYIGKHYTREEIDKVIAELITRHPYIEGSMSLHVDIIRKTSPDSLDSYFHMLEFQNYEYGKQEKGDTQIKFEK